MITIYWTRVVEKYPHLANEDDKTTMTVRGLRKLVEQAYELGHNHGFDNGKAWQKSQSQTTTREALERMFGM
jgi:hypothetical protein